MHYDVSNVRSKTWTEFTGPNAPSSICLHALRRCRSGGLPGLAGTADDRPLGHARPRRPGRNNSGDARYAFADTMRMLTNRINIFVRSLPMRSLDASSLQSQLDAIGKKRGQTPDTPESRRMNEKSVSVPQRLPGLDAGHCISAGGRRRLRGSWRNAFQAETSDCALCTALPTGAYPTVPTGVLPRSRVAISIPPSASPSPCAADFLGRTARS